MLISVANDAGDCIWLPVVLMVLQLSLILLLSGEAIVLRYSDNSY